MTPGSSDSGAVAVRYFSAGRLEAYALDPVFDYNRDSAGGVTFFKRLQQWLINKIGEVLFADSLRPLWTLLTYLAVAAVILFLVARLTKGTVRGLFQAADRPGTIDFEELDEDVEAPDLQRLIDQAVAQAKYRRAVRLLYLQMLKHLMAHRAIEWRKDKTNRDYLADLRESPLAASFTELTRIFDWIWYGGLPLELAQFEQIQGKFSDFYRSLSQTLNGT